MLEGVAGASTAGPTNGVNVSWLRKTEYLSRDTTMSKQGTVTTDAACAASYIHLSPDMTAYFLFVLTFLTGRTQQKYPLTSPSPPKSLQSRRHSPTPTPYRTSSPYDTLRKATCWRWRPTNSCPTRTSGPTRTTCSGLLNGQARGHLTYVLVLFSSKELRLKEAVEHRLSTRDWTVQSCGRKRATASISSASTRRKRTKSQRSTNGYGGPRFPPKKTKRRYIFHEYLSF